MKSQDCLTHLSAKRGDAGEVRAAMQQLIQAVRHLPHGTARPPAHKTPQPDQRPLRPLSWR